MNDEVIITISAHFSSYALGLLLAEEKFQSTDLESAIKEHSFPVTYITKITDSSNAHAGIQYYDDTIWPRLNSLGMNEDTKYSLMHCIQEMYVNALVHGNKAVRRNKDPQPYVANYEENKKKKVTIEAMLSNEIVVLRVSDQGNGLPESHEVTNGKNNDTLALTGRGLYTIEHNCDEVIHIKHNDGFSSCAIKYVKKPSVCQHT